MTDSDVIDKPLSKDSGEDQKPELVPAHTKPHYWLYKQGREVWNRWAREAFFDENGNDDGRIDKWIALTESKFKEVEQSSYLDKSELISGLQEKINLLNEFKESKPLSIDEKDELTKKIRKESKNKKYNLPLLGDLIDFQKTYWNESAYFKGFVFWEESSFELSRFSKSIDFRMSNFVSDAYFGGGDFIQSAGFDFALFESYAAFNETKFSSFACFESVIFLVEADFNSASFSSEADFILSSFLDESYFNRVTFSYDANFHSVSFLGDVNFRDVNFLSNSVFRSASFIADVDFSSAKFSKYVTFNFASFSSSAYFYAVSFLEDVSFPSVKFQFLYLHKTNFEGDADFNNAVFYTVPKVSGVSLLGVFNFNDVTWPEIKPSTAPSDDALSYSQLKRLMSDSHLHHNEIFFFRKELLCRAEAARRKSAKLTKSKLRLSKTLFKLFIPKFLPRLILKAKFYDTDWRVSKFIKLYDKISECGDSITRPLKMFLYLHVAMAVFYTFLSDKLGAISKIYSLDFSGLYKGFYLSLRHSVLFLPTSKKNYEAVMESMFPKIYGTGQFDLSYIFYVFASGAQTVLSIGLIFLVGLAIRNHLRIK